MPLMLMVQVSVELLFVPMVSFLFIVSKISVSLHIINNVDKE